MFKTIRAKLSLFSLSGLGLFALPLLARADVLDSLETVAEIATSPLKLVFFILTLITYATGYLGGILLTLMSALTDFMLDLNTKILPDSVGTITRGFETTLSIANLGFVIALIIIAFATILQIESFSMRQLLGKLVVAAILINFSLLIAGLLLDLSHVLTNFFLAGGNIETVNGVYSLGGSIANSLNPAQFLIEPSFDQISGDLATSITILVSAQFMSIFTWILAVVIGAVAVMFVIRYITITFLLILMPIAWISPLIPVKYFRDAGPKWWDNFLQQVFFLPIVAFFLVIATQSASGLSSVINNLYGTLGNYDASISQTGLNPNLLQILAQLVIVVGLVIGGLKAGIATGGVAGGLGNTFAQKAKKGILGGAKGLGRFGLQKSGLETAGRDIAGQVAPKVARIPLMQGVANKLAGAADPEKSIQARGKTYSNLVKSDEGRKALLARGPNSRDAFDQVAYLKAFIDSENLGDLAVKKADGSLNASATMQRLTPLVDAMKKTNSDTPPEKIKELQALAAAFPKLADRITGQSARQALSNADVKQLSDDTVKENIDLFSQRQLNAIAKQSDGKEALVNAALTGQLKNVDGGKLKEGGENSVVTRLDDINTRLEKQIAIEKDSSSNRAQKDAAGKEVQSLLLQRADVIDQIDVDAISLEERGIVNKMRNVAYSIGSSTATARKPRKNTAEGDDARAAADDLFRNI